MKSLSLIHLGDVHYPEAKNPLGAADIKDAGFPASVLARITPHPLAKVIEEVRAVLARRKDVVSILVSGDLTTYAGIDDYRACVGYLQGCLGDEVVWNEHSLHVVPGNHDVDRKRVALPDPTDESVNLDCDDSMSKFDDISCAWADAGLPILTVDAVRRTDLRAFGCHVPVFSLNSCLGCGEYRRLPSPFREALVQLMSDEGSAMPQHRAMLVEQLDTPAFDDSHLSDVSRSLSHLEPSIPAVVLAHHGILPQATPRVALYTEVINGGVARSQLASCRNPIIYCHGHIHESTVEIVSQPDGAGRPLVMVSAPQLDRGFNLITLYYTPEGLVLGCEITQYTLSTFGAVQARSPIRIPLGDRNAQEYSTDDTSSVIGRALSRDLVRFRSLFERVVESQPTATEEEVAGRLQEMEWLGIVDIFSREYQPRHWQIRRKVV